MKALTIPNSEEEEILETMIYEACLAYVDKWKNAKDSY